LLANPKYNSIEGRTEDIIQLRQIFSQAFLTKTLDEWRPLLEGLSYAPNQTLKDVMNDTQAIESGCFVAYEHPQRGLIRQVANPVRMSKDPASVRMPAPELGQHTEEVLLEYGYTWDDIARLKEEGTIA
jgi:crotonobetainyl-CoA:carnitine CoA-transferase CaiB-like acyl-CoA transferase